jgi:hypothetical protein
MEKRKLGIYLFTEKKKTQNANKENMRKNGIS